MIKTYASKEEEKSYLSWDGVGGLQIEQETLLKVTSELYIKKNKWMLIDQAKAMTAF